MENEDVNWVVCPDCKGQGTKSRGLSKKMKLRYQNELNLFEKSNGAGKPPIRPKAHQHSCSNCSGSGLVRAANRPIADTETFPHVAIIGAGIGGVALAVACLHRNIPFTLFERDQNFEARSQGYGLTLQQASKAIGGFGIFSLEDGVISTRHVVHTTEGKIIGEWGIRKWIQADAERYEKRTNVHIARQLLRLELLKQLGGSNFVQWGCQLIDFEESKNKGVELTFQTKDGMRKTTADLVVGADGIRSAVRKQLIGEDSAPLRYLDCIVILGICPLKDITEAHNSLLDSATVFQTANGNERIYIMPYTADSVMWQLSFPMPEEEAKTLSALGAKALKEEACRRIQWHDPIPQILAATQEAQISGYPVYDRELLTSEMLQKGNQITLIGDAAHPMSPFKGQGANQALLDALLLARAISLGCRSSAEWKEIGIREKVLNQFESEMLARSAVKVKDSAAAAEFLHSEIVLHEGDEPRGRCLKKDDRN